MPDASVRLKGALDVTFSALWSSSGPPTASTRSTVRIAASTIAAENGPAIGIRAGCQGGNIDPVSALVMAEVLKQVALSALGQMPTHYFGIKQKDGGRNYEFPFAVAVVPQYDKVLLKDKFDHTVFEVDPDRWDLVLYEAKVNDPFGAFGDAFELGTVVNRPHKPEMDLDVLMRWLLNESATVERRREENKTEEEERPVPPLRYLDSVERVMLGEEHHVNLNPVQHHAHDGHYVAGDMPGYQPFTP